MQQYDRVDSGTRRDPHDLLPTLQDMHKHYDVVFVDHTGYCNLLAQMTIDTYHLVDGLKYAQVQRYACS